MMLLFLESGWSIRVHRLRVRANASRTQWQRPLATLCSLTMVIAFHGLILFWYGQNADAPPLKKAVPLPSIDITLSAFPSKTVAPTLSQRPQAEPKPLTKPNSAPSRRPAKKKIASQPREPVPEVGNPPPSSTPTIATQPAQERVVPPPLEETVPPVSNANYLQNPSPEYPVTARNRRWEGEVLLKVFVNADGICGDLTVLASSGHEVLDQAAVDAVKHWRFVPAKRGDIAVSSWVTVPISFKLDI